MSILLVVGAAIAVLALCWHAGNHSTARVAIVMILAGTGTLLIRAGQVSGNNEAAASLMATFGAFFFLGAIKAFRTWFW